MMSAGSYCNFECFRNLRLVRRLRYYPARLSRRIRRIPLTIHAPGDAFTVFVALDRDGFHVDARRRLIFVVEGLLRFHQRSGLLVNDPREGVTRHVVVDVFEAGLFRVTFEVLDEGV